MSITIVTIFEGPHYTEKIAKQYRAIGSINVVKMGARVKCGQLAKTRGLRVWVNFDKVDGTPITHSIFQEDARI